MFPSKLNDAVLPEISKLIEAKLFNSSNGIFWIRFEKKFSVSPSILAAFVKLLKILATSLKDKSFINCVSALWVGRGICWDDILEGDVMGDELGGDVIGGCKLGGCILGGGILGSDVEIGGGGGGGTGMELLLLLFVV